MPENELKTTSMAKPYQSWLKQQYAVDDLVLQPLSGDAGSRRYFRFFLGNQSLILTDFSREPTHMQSFCQHTQAFAALNLPVPHIMMVDQHNHYLIQADLGDTTLLKSITDTPSSYKTLYAMALGILLQLQQQSHALQSLPQLNTQAIQQELDCFDHWYCDRYLAAPLSTSERQIWQSCCKQISQAMGHQPQVAVHRDFHARNLMVTENTMTMIDHQDAVIGPVGYDIISLAYDCYVDHPVAQRLQWLKQHHQALQQQHIIPADTTFNTYQDWCMVCAGQRLLKVLGVFARLGLRDQKLGFLKDLHLTHHHLMSVITSHPILKPLHPIVQSRPPHT